MASMIKDMGLIEFIVLPFALFIFAILVIKILFAIPRKRNRRSIAERTRRTRSRNAARGTPPKGFRTMKSSAQRIREREREPRD